MTENKRQEFTIHMKMLDETMDMLEERIDEYTHLKVMSSR